MASFQFILTLLIFGDNPLCNCQYFLYSFHKVALSFYCVPNFCQAEIQAVLAMGVGPDRIIYANPCKQSNYIKFASKVGVDLMTFDNVNELRKTKAVFPDAR